MGCGLNVEINGDDVKVIGQVCKIGEKYAKEEITNPTRNIATSVRVEGGDIPMLSVKNKQPVPKGKIMDVVKAVHTVKMQAPIKVGDIVLANAADSGVDFIATRVVEKIS